jgi:serine/threonine protein kinase
LNAGTTIGRYEIVCLLGQGGMGEVYRARDKRLGRDVALKVLPNDFPDDSDRLRRFEQEARTLAGLNHSNLLVVHDTGVHEGQPYLVSELLAGKTLREQLSSGALSTRRAVECAVQIAQGLAAAHGSGVVHRDLKPENLFLTNDGRVKILDFGLAKLRGPSPVVRPSSLREASQVTGQGTAQPASVEAPTVRDPPAPGVIDSTQPGMVLGTPAYMAPEQVRGEPADHRADLFAFGCVLYEMLSGQRAFRRNTTVETMTAILNDEPPELPLTKPELPPGLARILHRCLEKQPERRFQSATDLAFALESLSGTSHAALPSLATAKASGLERWRRLVTVLAGIGLLLLAGSIGSWLTGKGPSSKAPLATTGVEPAVFQATIELPTNAPLILGRVSAAGPLMAISPDGQEVVYVADVGGTTQLYRRSLRTLEAKPIPGTEGAVHPFYSPDGRWLGFLTRERLAKVPRSGGNTVPVCPVNAAVQATWGDDGYIYVANIYGYRLGRVHATEGHELSEVPEFSRFLESEMRAWATEVLPGATAILAGCTRHSLAADQADIVVIALGQAAAPKRIARGYGAHYVRSGHVVYAQYGSLMAVPFDPKTLEVLGDPVLMVTNVAMEALYSRAQFDVSANGTLVYAAGGDLGVGRIAVMARDGQPRQLDMPARIYGVFGLSPDGNRLAIHVSDVMDYIWIYDLLRQEGTRLTKPGLNCGWPVWSPDGRDVLFAAGEGTNWTVYRQPAEAGTEPRALVKTGPVAGLGLSPKEPLLVVSPAALRGNTRLIDLSHPSAEPPLARGGKSENLGVFSPDNRRVAYWNDRLGQAEAWVRTQPDDGKSEKVSLDGGGEVLWVNTNDLVYRKGNEWFLVQLPPDSNRPLAPPRRVFVAENFVDTPGLSYAISPNAERLYFVQAVAHPVRNRLYVIQNWFAELREHAPPKRRP